MSALADSLSSLKKVVRDEGSIRPPVPDSLAETGVAGSVIEQLILKYLYFRGEMLGREIASQLGLEFSLIDEMLEGMKRSHLSLIHI